MSRWTLPCLLPLVLLALPAPLAAQSFAELERLADLSATEEGGLALAREQAGRGAYLEALATLERVMAAFPRSPGPQLLHAIYLCRVDDRQGGLVEIERMDADAFGRQNLIDARELCNRPFQEPARNAAPPPPRAAPPPAPVSVAPPPPAAMGAPGTGSTPASQPSPPANPDGKD